MGSTMKDDNGIVIGPSRKCPPGCSCGRHKHTAWNRGLKCLENCTCAIHSNSGRPPCTENCQCGNHISKACPENCKCGKHFVSEETRLLLKLNNSHHPAWNKGKPETEEAKMQRIVTNLERYGRADGPRFDTLPERVVENWLSSQGLRYLKQHPVCGILVDFYLPATKTIIEVDGCYWHGHGCSRVVPWADEIRQKDACKTKKLLAADYSIVRLWECEIYDADSNYWRCITDCNSSRSSYSI